MAHFERSLQNQATASSAMNPSAQSSSSEPTTHWSAIGAIVGGVIGGLSGVALAVSAVILFYRQRLPRVLSTGKRSQQHIEPFPYNSAPSQNVADATKDLTSPQPPPDTATIEQRHSHAHNSRIITPIGPEAAAPADNVPTDTIPGHELPSVAQEVVISQVRELRTELENLRRVVQQIVIDNDERPPTYAGSRS